MAAHVSSTSFKACLDSQRQRPGEERVLQIPEGHYKPTYDLVRSHQHLKQESKSTARTNLQSNTCCPYKQELHCMTV